MKSHRSTHGLLKGLVDFEEHLCFCRKLALDVGGAEDALEIEPRSLAVEPFFERLAEEVELPLHVVDAGFDRSHVARAADGRHVHLAVVQEHLDIINTTENENIFGLAER